MVRLDSAMSYDPLARIMQFRAERNSAAAEGSRDRALQVISLLTRAHTATVGVEARIGEMLHLSAGSRRDSFAGEVRRLNQGQVVDLQREIDALAVDDLAPLQSLSQIEDETSFVSKSPNAFGYTMREIRTQFAHVPNSDLLNLRSLDLRSATSSVEAQDAAQKALTAIAAFKEGIDRSLNRLVNFATGKTQQMVGVGTIPPVVDDFQVSPTLLHSEVDPGIALHLLGP